MFGIGIGIGFYLLTTIAGLAVQNGTIHSQSQTQSSGGNTCPPGMYWMQTSDGTEGCVECSSECASPSPRPCSCPEGAILVNDYLCMMSVPIGEYPICEPGDHYYPPEGICANVYSLVEGVPCKEGYLPFLYENKMLCVHRYSPFNASCPFGYKQENELCIGFTDSICETPTPTPTTYLRSSASPSSTPSPSFSSSGCYEWSCQNDILPNHTSLFSHPICIYVQYDGVANSEGYLTCPNGGELWGKKCYVWRESYLVPCTSPSASASFTPREVPSASSTPTLKEVPSASASFTPREVPSASSTPTLKASASFTPREVPSASPTPTMKASPSFTPREVSSASPTPTLKASPSFTPREVPSASSTPTMKASPSFTPREVPSASPTPTLKEVPSASFTPREVPSPTMTPKCSQYICREPSILVRERFCYWNETIPAKPRCQENDIYNEDKNEKMCVKYYIPENTTTCKDGYHFVIHEDNPYCIQKYEPNFNNCPEGFRYHVDDSGKELCSKVTDAICVSTLLRSTSSTPTAKPSQRCTDTKNPRCTKPDSILNELPPNVALSPLPSRRPIATLLAVVSKLPLPSPWTRPVVADVVDIPLYIPSRITIPQIDSSIIEKPEKIQEIQASLACTLRLPLEKIRINTIRFVNVSTGIGRLAHIDPSMYLLDSAGSAECFMFTSATRNLQSTKGTLDEKVEIDYFIVNPPIEIASLNQTEFNDILKQSPVLKSFVESVGGETNDISSAIMFENYALITEPSQSPSPTSSSSKFPTYGIGVIAGLGGLIALMVFGVFIKRSRARQVTLTSLPPPTTNNPAFVVVNNPYGRENMTNFPPTYSSV